MRMQGTRMYQNVVIAVADLLMHSGSSRAGVFAHSFANAGRGNEIYPTVVRGFRCAWRLFATCTLPV